MLRSFHVVTLATALMLGAGLAACSSVPPAPAAPDAGGDGDASPPGDTGPDGADFTGDPVADAIDQGQPDEVGPPPLDMSPTGMGLVGKACADQTECGANGFCATEADSGLPDGYCTIGCDPGSPGSCGAGNGCLELGQTILCVQTCTTDADCRDGYGCADTFFGTALADGSKVCAAGRTDARPGDPCEGVRDCAPGSGFCLGETDSGFRGGYCSALCDPATPGSCGDGGSCVETAFGAFCAGLCPAAADPLGGCREGYQCTGGFYGASSDDDVCAPGVAEQVPVGSPCADASGCTAGTQLCFRDDSGYPGGYCSQGCDSRQAGSCGDGYCLAPDGTRPAFGVCLAGCPGTGTAGDEVCAGKRTDDPSGATYGCTERIFGYPLPGGAHVCLPFDASASLGDPCIGAGNCPIGTSCLTAQQGFPEGYCSDVCDPAQPTGCGDGALCWPLDPQQPAAGGVCLLRCEGDAACRADGYSCAPTGAGGADPACIPE
jgi:hypothetical protein